MDQGTSAGMMKLRERSARVGHNSVSVLRRMKVGLDNRHFSVICSPQELLGENDDAID